jgi:phosphoenolpyruvate phosphomutase
MTQWDGRAPVTIVPTKYSHVTPDVFEAAGISVVIWANQVLRASLRAMEQTCQAVRKEGTMLHLESEIADLSRVFELTNNAELEQAKKLYSQYIPPRGGTRHLDTDLVTD